jgi:two-component system, NtrC family, sensor histidine kinase PilS
VELHITPLWDRSDRRSGSLLLLEDLTEISSMEDRVKRAERLAALGRLAAGVAHEIRNPLASVSGSLELLQATPNADEDDRRLIGIAVREVDRLATLVTNLLEYARPRPLMHMELDLVELAREVATACAQDPVFEGVELEVAAPEGSVVVDVDAGQLRQVLWNLYRNAGEVTDAGVVEVEVRRWLEGDPPGVQISVTDHGPGIPAEDREHIFEPFFTTKDAGTGLGLAIVHRIVEDHEGTLEVNSPLPDGPGTRITLRLPDYRPEPTPLPVDPEPLTA